MEQNCAQERQAVDSRALDLTPAKTRCETFLPEEAELLSFSENVKPTGPDPKPVAFQTKFAGGLCNCTDRCACLRSKSWNKISFNQATSPVLSQKKLLISDSGCSGEKLALINKRKRKRKQDIGDMKWDVAVDVLGAFKQPALSECLPTVTEMFEDWIPADR